MATSCESETFSLAKVSSLASRGGDGYGIMGPLWVTV